jgi:hypothetical protein
MYGGMPAGGGYTSATEYEIGAQRIAEAAHCLLGSLGSVGPGDDWGMMLKYERGHIHEELGIITDAMREYSRDLYSRRMTDVSMYKAEHRPDAWNYVEQSVESIRKASPKLAARAKEKMKLVGADTTIPTPIRYAAITTYLVLIDLANAMERSVADWPEQVPNGFQDPQLKTSVQELERHIANLYA